eukprot:s5909_g2.t1
MVSRRLPVAYSAASAIASCGHAQQWQRALRLFEMVSAVLHPDVKAVAFNAAIWACERAVQWQHCMALLESADGGPPSASSFLACASAYQQAQRWQDWVLRRERDALHLLVDSFSQLPQVSQVAQMILLRGFVAMQCWRRSLHVFEDMRRDGHGDLLALNAVLTSLADASQWCHALRLLRLGGALDRATEAQLLRALQRQHMTREELEVTPFNKDLAHGAAVKIGCVTGMIGEFLDD